MSQNIDVFKPVRQKNGRGARITGLVVGEAIRWPIKATVNEKDGSVNETTFSSTGIHDLDLKPSDQDIENFEPPVEYTFWANIYSTRMVPDVYFHGDEEDAKDARRDRNDAIACVEVTYTEGEGLD